MFFYQDSKDNLRKQYKLFKNDELSLGITTNLSRLFDKYDEAFKRYKKTINLGFKKSFKVEYYKKILIIIKRRY